MTSITKRFSFEAAHVLPWHKGKCSRLHGHSYILEVTVTSRKLDKNGIILDFSDLKAIVKDRVIDPYDHTLLNDSFDNPTAELLVQSFWQEIKDALENLFPKVFLKRLVLCETEDSRAEIE